MTIFIPVLWICLNGHCEFMQQMRHFTDEESCKEAVLVQKQKMRDMAAETGETITQLEGTCIDATIRRIPQSAGGEIMVEQTNGHDAWLAMENAKKDYMEKCWGMTHAQLFSELMRVHTESAKMLQTAQEKIAELERELEDDGK